MISYIHQHGLGSTSRDWVPSSQIGPEAPRTHFDSIFSNSKYQDAPLIILLVGSNDTKAGITPSQTIDNLESITTVLAQMGI